MDSIENVIIETRTRLQDAQRHHAIQKKRVDEYKNDPMPKGSEVTRYLLAIRGEMYWSGKIQGYLESLQLAQRFKLMRDAEAERTAEFNATI